MKIKKIISLVLVAAMIAGVAVIATISSGASGTGTGLSEWALNAYYSKWSYVYGGSTPGAVDCSGLIYSYTGGYRVGDAQYGNSSYTGSVSSGIPNIHGLGLYQPGHVGVYVGGGMAVDARGDDYGVCYQSAYSHNWTMYFKVPGVSYPTTGWEEMSGEYYYYENGQYLASTSREIDGVTYYFDESGVSSSSPSDTSAAADTSEDTSNDTDDDTSYDTDDNDTAETAEDSSVMKNGSYGDNVVKLQQRLYDLGYYQGGIDGDFGDKTEQAFKLFQQTLGLYVDGIAGSDVEYLFADDAPVYSPAEEETSAENEKEDLAQTGANEDEDVEAETDPAEDESFKEFSNGDYDEDIISIQERLIALGYLDGDADGAFGSLTEAAVKAFQDAAGMTQSGVVDESTYELLFSNSAVKNPVEKKADEDNNSDDKIEKIEKEEPETVPATSPQTEVVMQASQLSEKALSGVTDSITFKYDANATNFEFILWLAIMIVVMLITFAIVYSIEKKKMRATAKAARRFQ